MSVIKAADDKRNIFGIKDITNYLEFHWIRLIKPQSIEMGIIGYILAKLPNKEYKLRNLPGVSSWSI